MKRLICWLFILIPLTTWGQSEAFYFIQMTDTQFGMTEDNKGFSEETKAMEKAIVAINRLTPAFVVVTGDLVNDGKDKAQIAEFKRICGKLNKRIPLYLTPGNHDVGQQATDESVKNYIDEYGYDCFSFQIANTCFIGLNTQIIWAGREEKENAQFVWLKKTLENSQKCNHRIILGHHPLFIKTADEPDRYENIPLLRRKIYLDLFSAYHADYMFAGHLHYNAGGTSDKFNLSVTNAVGKSLGKDKSGIRIVKIYSDRVESVYYDLDKIPATIGL